MGWVYVSKSLLNKLHLYAKWNKKMDKNSRVTFPNSNDCHSSCNIRRKTPLFCLIYITTVFLLILYFQKRKSSEPIANFLQNRRHDADLSWIPVHISELMFGESLKLPQNDERIMKYIWDAKLLEPPSTEENYNLTNPYENSPSGTGQFIQELLQNKTNGFFVEAAALDGEAMSNTLFLEREYGWKGLLIETDPSNYAEMKLKQRKSWMSNSCLAKNTFPHRAEFVITRNLEDVKIDSPDAMRINAQCLPLFSLLSALNVTTVDYFSLDLQGEELAVLRTIPFNKVFIKTLSVFVHNKEESYALVEFMDSKGYEMFREMSSDNQNNDFIFVHTSLSSEM